MEGGLAALLLVISLYINLRFLSSKPTNIPTLYVRREPTLHQDLKYSEGQSAKGVAVA